MRGVGRSFEGRGGLVLIKGEREYYMYVTTAVQAFIFYREKNSAFFFCLRRRASNRNLKILMYQYVCMKAPGCYRLLPAGTNLLRALTVRFLLYCTNVLPTTSILTQVLLVVGAWLVGVG